MVAYSVGCAKVIACLHYGLINVCSKWELRYSGLLRSE